MHCHCCHSATSWARRRVPGLEAARIILRGGAGEHVEVVEKACAMSSFALGCIDVVFHSSPPIGTFIFDGGGALDLLMLRWIS